MSIGRLLSHPATWAIIIVNIVNHWGYFIYLNWMPSYFVKVGPQNGGCCCCLRGRTVLSGKMLCCVAVAPRGNPCALVSVFVTDPSLRVYHSSDFTHDAAVCLCLCVLPLSSLPLPTTHHPKPTHIQALGFDLRSSSFLSLVPWLVMAVGSSAAGFLADSLIAAGHSTTYVRKLLQSVSMLVPAAALLFLANPSIPPLAAVAAMTAALGVTSLGQAGFVANMSDIAPQQAGQMFGLCNTFGCLSGIAGVLAVGFIVEVTGSFTPVFLITAGLYVVAVIAWNLLCTGERVF